MYELNRIELLRDLFAWAYERSCQRYTQLREALPSPDPLRLRYRNELAEIVRETVRAGEAVDLNTVRVWCPEMVAAFVRKLWRLPEHDTRDRHAQAADDAIPPKNGISTVERVNLMSAWARAIRFGQPPVDQWPRGSHRRRRAGR